MPKMPTIIEMFRRVIQIITLTQFFSETRIVENRFAESKETHYCTVCHVYCWAQPRQCSARFQVPPVRRRLSDLRLLTISGLTSAQSPHWPQCSSAASYPAKTSDRQRTIDINFHQISA